MDNKTIQQQKDEINILSQNLKNINYDEIYELLEKTSWKTTARVFGFKIINYDNLKLAGRMIIHDLKTKIGTSFKTYIGRMESLMNDDVVEFMKNHTEQLNILTQKMEERDIKYDWFSANSLIRVYLTKKLDPENKEDYYETENGYICETPVQLWMRISVSLYWKKGLNEIKKMFNHMCKGYYIPASPTIFNAGMKRGQMSSCFLLAIDDNIESIYDKLKEQALISKNNGAVGVDMSLLRHSKIGSDGKSSGIFPWVHLYNSSTRAVNQNGKRKGASTLFCRPHHIDIYEFCEGSLRTGDSYRRAHDVNYALWFPWLFWDRLEKDDKWTLFCPAETPKLNNKWGTEWTDQYILYENDPTIPKKVINAKDLMSHIVNIQRKTGMPYILHGDSVNMKTNQKNLGYIRSSNLCLEICEYSSSDETPSCNLSSISLRAFTKGKYDTNKGVDRKALSKVYDFNKLGKISSQLVLNLNQVIEENKYFVSTIEKSNNKHRPIGIGVSGFADMLHKLNLPFQDSDDNSKPHPVTSELNKMIFACIYWNALASSVDIAVERGRYSTFEGSPISEGKFQFDLWKEEYNILRSKNMINDRIRKKEDDDEIEPKYWNQKQYKLSNGYIIKPTWDDLRIAIKKFGIRNSLLIALMPTATTAQPLRNSETVAAHQSNIYSRKVMKGAYPVVNRYLVKDLTKLGLWNRDIIGLIQANNGSVSLLPNYININLDNYPGFDKWDELNVICNKYKTMWELSMKIFLKMAADRGRYVCQSQSTNVYLGDPSDEELFAVHVYAQKLGLKTGMYYLRERAAVDPIKFSVDHSITKFVDDTLKFSEKSNNKEEEEPKLTLKKKFVCNDEICVACQ